MYCRVCSSNASPTTEARSEVRTCSVGERATLPTAVYSHIWDAGTSILVAKLPLAPLARTNVACSKSPACSVRLCTLQPNCDAYRLAHTAVGVFYWIMSVIAVAEEQSLNIFPLGSWQPLLLS